jgi:hypothetical protein
MFLFLRHAPQPPGVAALFQRQTQPRGFSFSSNPLPEFDFAPEFCPENHQSVPTITTGIATKIAPVFLGC